MAIITKPQYLYRNLTRVHNWFTSTIIVTFEFIKQSILSIDAVYPGLLLDNICNFGCKTKSLVRKVQSITELSVEHWSTGSLGHFFVNTHTPSN